MAHQEWRVQVRLDTERYGRLETESRRRGRSVAATVRDAIDRLLDVDARRQMAARRAVVRMPTGGAPEPEFRKDRQLEASA